MRCGGEELCPLTAAWAGEVTVSTALPALSIWHTLKESYQQLKGFNEIVQVRTLSILLCNRPTVDRQQLFAWRNLGSHVRGVLHTGYLVHGNSKGKSRGRSRHKNNSERVVRNQKERNEDTNRKVLIKQGLTCADYYYFNRLCDCPEKGSSNFGRAGIVHCNLWARVDCEGNAIPAPPITTSSANRLAN